jgi:hypothetical protein
MPGEDDAATAVDQRNAGELSSVCTAQKGTTELSEWIEMRQAAAATAAAGQGMERIPARRVCTCCAQRRARSSYCNNSNCYSHSTKVPSAYKSLARHRRKCFCVFLYPGHKVLPSCCLFVSKRASERASEALACLLAVCV